MRFFYACAIAVTMCLTGCFSLDTAVLEVDGREHIVASNYGWSLFNCIPLFCGNANDDGKRVSPWAFFRDDVTMEKVQSRLLEHAKSEGKDAEELVFHNYDSVLMWIPMAGISLPIPYLVCYKEVQLSGVLK